MSLPVAGKSLALFLALSVALGLLWPVGQAQAGHLPPLTEIALRLADLPPDFAPADEPGGTALLPDGLARQVTVSFRRAEARDGEPGVRAVRQVVLAFDDRDAADYAPRFRDLMARRQGYGAVDGDERSFRLSRTRDGETSVVAGTAIAEILAITTVSGAAGTVSADDARALTRATVARVPVVEQSAAAISLDPGRPSLSNAQLGVGNLDLPPTMDADRWPQPTRELPGPPPVAVVQARSRWPARDAALSELMPTQHGEVRPAGWPDDLAQYVHGIAPLINQFWSRSLAMTNIDYLPPRLHVVKEDENVVMACRGPDRQPKLARSLSYCMADESIYLYEPFLRDDLVAGQDWRSRDFVVATVLAHEWAHHIQSMTGVAQMGVVIGLNQLENWPIATRMVELQADCYAGMFARSARDNGWLNAGDLQEAQEAMLRAGDDHVESVGHHGLPEQRKEWFMRGFTHYAFSACQPY